MKKYILKTLNLLITSLLLVPNIASAQGYKIIAIVNDESISNVQLRDRLKIIMNSTGMPNTRENTKKVAIEAYEILINEILQKQEAKEKGVDLTDQQMQAAIRDLEIRNKIPPGGFKKFIESKGLSYEATIDQINAGLLWRKTITRLFKDDVQVSEEEITAEAKNFSKKDIKRSVNISEIVIPIDYDMEDETYAKAMDISKRANSGESFAELAKLYSAGKSAKEGGVIGWIDEPTIKPPLDEEIVKLKNGKVGEPIRVDEMYVIIKLNERRVINPSKDRKALAEKVLTEKLETRSKKYIKGLRQKAYIEKRYKGKDLLDALY